MFLIAKVAILIGFIAAGISITKTLLSERPVLLEFGIVEQRQVIAVLLMWACTWVPIAVLLPFAGGFLVNPVPLGALLAIPAVVVFRNIKRVLEHGGTDRTKRAEDATNHAIFLGYASAILAIADWGFAFLVSSLPGVTGGQL